jgi:AraC family transcriptional activator of pobA
MGTNSLALYDPRLGEPALKVELLEPIPGLAEPRRSNYFTLLWIQSGRGTFWADLTHHPFEAPSLLFLSPYQTLRLVPESPVGGHIIRFHANFFCIETYHEEVGCNGILFNDVYGIPLIRLDAAQEREVGGLVGAMRRELQERGLAHDEVLVSFLKILLIRATRMKLDQQDLSWEPSEIRPAVLDELKRLIESHFRGLHGPGDYASRLHMTPKSLGKLVKTHLHKTLTELIRERILRQAKWEMLHTTKPVKQVARELGFEDVFYFSRLFKRATGLSPAYFREYETEIRGGRNLSMPWRGPSIPPVGPLGQNADDPSESP